jgi:hypothetical protein
MNPSQNSSLHRRVHLDIVRYPAITRRTQDELVLLVKEKTVASSVDTVDIYSSFCSALTFPLFGVFSFGDPTPSFLSAAGFDIYSP